MSEDEFEALAVRLLSAYATGKQSVVVKGKITNIADFLKRIKQQSQKNTYKALAQLLFSDENQVSKLFLDLHSTDPIDVYRQKLVKHAEFLARAAHLFHGVNDARKKEALRKNVGKIKSNLIMAQYALCPALRSLPAWNNAFFSSRAGSIIPPFPVSVTIFRKESNRCTLRGIREVLFANRGPMPPDLVEILSNDPCPSEYHSAHDHAAVIVQICKAIPTFGEWRHLFPPDFWDSEYFKSAIKDRINAVTVNHLPTYIQLCDSLGDFAHMQDDAYYQQDFDISDMLYNERIAQLGIAGPACEFGEDGSVSSLPATDAAVYMPWNALSAHRMLFAASPVVFARAVANLHYPRVGDSFFPGIFSAAYISVVLGESAKFVVHGSKKGEIIRRVLAKAVERGLDAVEEHLGARWDMFEWPPSAIELEECIAILDAMRSVSHNAHADYQDRIRTVETILGNVIAHARVGSLPTRNSWMEPPSVTAAPAGPARLRVRPLPIAPVPDGEDEAIDLQWLFENDIIDDTVAPLVVGAATALDATSSPEVIDAFRASVGLFAILGAGNSLRAMLTDRTHMPHSVMRFCATVDIPVTPLPRGVGELRILSGITLNDVAEGAERTLQGFIGGIRDILRNPASPPWALTPRGEELYKHAVKLETIDARVRVSAQPDSITARWPVDDLAALRAWLAERRAVRHHNVIPAFADLVRAQETAVLMAWDRTAKDTTGFVCPAWWRTSFGEIFSTVFEEAKQTQAVIDGIVSDELSLRIAPWDEVRVLTFLDTLAIEGALARPEIDLLDGMGDSYFRAPPRWRPEVTDWLHQHKLYSVAEFWKIQEKPEQEIVEFVANTPPQGLHFPYPPDPTKVHSFVCAGSKLPTAAHRELREKMMNRRTDLGDALERVSVRALLFHLDRVEWFASCRESAIRGTHSIPNIPKLREFVYTQSQECADSSPLFDQTYPPEKRLYDALQYRLSALDTLWALLGDAPDRLDPAAREVLHTDEVLRLINEYAEAFYVKEFVADRIVAVWPASRGPFL